jgi:hypothetical protein
MRWGRAPPRRRRARDLRDHRGVIGSITLDRADHMEVDEDLKDLMTLPG